MEVKLCRCKSDILFWAMVGLEGVGLFWFSVERYRR